MSCEKHDWKAYALGELDRPARAEAESHHATCVRCREELATLRLTLDTLSTLREEEIPRRIAFVSDKVFEPKWWQKGFFEKVLSPNLAAACVIAAAILVHAFARPSGPDPAQTQALIQAQVSAAVNEAVAQQTAATLNDLRPLVEQVRQTFIREQGIVRQ
ncbi:MAG TPA: zf-HC2 domain-containing protein [Bryobacteraceae bacterium]|jgi:anti-sigma factor RsiW